MKRIRLLGLVVAVFLLNLTCCPAETPAVPRKITVLLADWGSAAPEEIFRELKAQGIEPAWCSTLAGITPEYLRQFNVVVVPTVIGDAGIAAGVDLKKTAGLFRAYAEEGGGLLIFKDLYAARGISFWQELLAPVGAEILVEQIAESDPANLWQTRIAGPFSWTDILEKHPATEGVEGLAYPLARYEPGEPGAITFKTDPNWKVLIRTRPTAASFLPDPAANDYKKVTGPGTYSSSVPLLAVREYGKGRIALWPWLPAFTL
ncbi:MAG: hypothetical protein L6437_04745, partial [Kiritimatiellae bacterium]|nr:hypothetical protein [Verrucomicrobiota bacterium]MCG2659538.1 hypothetical protein [Kiritimatiellia bacterium]